MVEEEGILPNAKFSLNLAKMLEYVTTGLILITNSSSSSISTIYSTNSDDFHKFSNFLPHLNIKCIDKLNCELLLSPFPSLHHLDSINNK